MTKRRSVAPGPLADWSDIKAILGIGRIAAGELKRLSEATRYHGLAVKYLSF